MSELRPFTFFGNTAPVQVTGVPVSLTNMDGTCAAAGYLQLFDLASAEDSLESTVTVPLQSYKIAAAGPLVSIFQNMGGISFKNGLAVAFSSTDKVYTAVSTEFSIFGEYEEYEVPVPSDANDSTTDPNTNNAFTIWETDDTKIKNKVLYELVVTNTSGAVGYLLLSCTALVQPILNFKVENAETKTFRFGTEGFSPYKKTAAGVHTNGCYLLGSSTPITLTPTGDSTWDVQAKFKDL